MTVRSNAARALGEIGDARAVEPLIDILKDWWTRGTAQRALLRIGTPEALAALEAWRKRQRGE